MLKNGKIKRTFGWKPVRNVEKTMEKSVEWLDCYLKHGDIVGCMERQIKGLCGE